MAYSVVSTTSRSMAGVVTQFICDAAADVSSLPTGSGSLRWADQPAPGSSALVAETKEIYALTPARTWVSVAVLP